MSNKAPEDTKSYLLRDIPAGIHQAAKERAERDGLELKGVLIGLLETYAKHGVRIFPRGISIPQKGR